MTHRNKMIVLHVSCSGISLFAKDGRRARQASTLIAASLTVAAQPVNFTRFPVPSAASVC